MEIFAGYTWPGNVRELRNTLEYAFVTAESQIIRPENLPHKLLNTTEGVVAGNRSISGQTDENQEKEELIAALKKVRGNQTKAAQLLGVSRVTIWKRMQKYEINVNKVILPSRGNGGHINLLNN